MTDQPLITKYRPQSFDQVIGNEICIKQLAEAVRSSTRPHSYLFTGCTGIGKTTLARIIASEVKATITEIDAASNSGIDDTKGIVSRSVFRPILDPSNPNLLVIIDECHGLSKQAWQPLLKLVEEPPPYLYIALCTTDATKVPDTIKSRSYPISLKPLRVSEIEDLISVIAELEGWTVDNGVFQAIVQASDGSARKALTILQAGHGLASREELSKVISAVEIDSSPVIEICKILSSGARSWKRIAPLIAKIDDYDEAVNHATRYFTTVLSTKTDDNSAEQIWWMVKAFADTQSWDKKVHFYTAIGRILWEKF